MLSGLGCFPGTSFPGFRPSKMMAAAPDTPLWANSWGCQQPPKVYQACSAKVYHPGD